MRLTFSVANKPSVQVLLDAVGGLQERIQMSCDVRKERSTIICSLEPK